MKTLFLSLLFLASAALGSRSFAQTTITLPSSGGSYTVNAPTGYKFISGPTTSGDGFTYSYATTSDVCNVTASANNSYARSVTVTWTLALKTAPTTTAGTLTYTFYQDTNIALQSKPKL